MKYIIDGFDTFFPTLREVKAEDYIIVEGCLGNPYFAYKTKSKYISEDRRLITDYEIIGLFENYLKRYCIKHKTSNVEVCDGDGNVIFETEIKGPLLDIVKSEMEDK